VVPGYERIGDAKSKVRGISAAVNAWLLRPSGCVTMPPAGTAPPPPRRFITDVRRPYVCHYCSAIGDQLLKPAAGIAIGYSKRAPVVALSLWDARGFGRAPTQRVKRGRKLQVGSLCYVIARHVFNFNRGGGV